MDEKEYLLLKELKESAPQIPQRELAKRTGLSLGMTNLLLKRMIQTGLVKISRLNSRNLSYLLTSQGLEKITRKSIQYIRRTVGDLHGLRVKVEELVRSLSAKGYEGLELVGESELDFILEYACTKEGLSFFQNSRPLAQSGIYTVYGEKNQGQDGRQDVLNLLAVSSY